MNYNGYVRSYQSIELWYYQTINIPSVVVPSRIVVIRDTTLGELPSSVMCQQLRITQTCFDHGKNHAGSINLSTLASFGWNT